MKDSRKWDNMESFLLKECYTLAAQYEANSSARDILRSKGRKISIPDGYVPDSNNIELPYSTQKIVSDVLYALTMENAAAPATGSFGLQAAVSAMPNCGEKEYLLAILSLRSGRSESNRLEALRHISLALSQSINDPRYTALADILQQNNG